MENDRRGYQKLCSDCATYGLTKHGLTRYGCIPYYLAANFSVFGTDVGLGLEKLANSPGHL